MAELLPPILDGESPERIRTRMLAAVPDLATAVEGSWEYDLAAAVALEIYDICAVTALAVLQRMFISTAPADTLPLHGERMGVPPKDAVAAVGTVTFAGTNGTVIPIGTLASTAAGAAAPAQAFRTTQVGTISAGTAEVPVEAVTAGATGNVGSGAVLVLSSAVAGISSVTNAEAMSGGTDAEDLDTAYRARLLQAAGRIPGQGNVDSYIEWALAQPGVGVAGVIPRIDGDGTVGVLVLDDAGEIPVTDALKDAVKEALDPVASEGEGRGLAPIDDLVSVDYPDAFAVSYAVPDLVPAADTPLGTARAAVSAALEAFTVAARPGDTLRVKDAENVVHDTAGVADFGDVTINGVHANLALDPDQKAVLGAVSFP